jgi:hypothetical protein
MAQEETASSQVYYRPTSGILFKLRQFRRVTKKDLEVKPRRLKNIWHIGIKTKSAYKTACHTSPGRKWCKTFEMNVSPLAFVLHLFTISETEINYCMACVPTPSNQWNRPHKYFSSNFCRYNEINQTHPDIPRYHKRLFVRNHSQQAQTKSTVQSCALSFITVMFAVF